MCFDNVTIVCICSFILGSGHLYGGWGKRGCWGEEVVGVKRGVIRGRGHGV